MLRGQGMEYTVLGDAVNLAARLMANAPANGILIDESTKRHGSHVVKHALCVCACVDCKHYLSYQNHIYHYDVVPRMEWQSVLWCFIALRCKVATQCNCEML